MERCFICFGIFLFLGNSVFSVSFSVDANKAEYTEVKRLISDTPMPESSLANKQIVFGPDEQKQVQISDVIKDDLTMVSACHWINLDGVPNKLTFLWQYSTSQVIAIGTVMLGDAIPRPIVHNNVPKYVLPEKSLLNDGRWHHICLTWEQVDGTLGYYEDGVLERSAPGHGYVGDIGGIAVIENGGILTLGSDKNDLVWRIAGFNLWQDVLDDSAIFSLYNCEQNGLGDLFSWGNARIGLSQANIQLSDVFLEQGIFPVCIGCTRYVLHFGEEPYEMASSTCKTMGDDSMLAKLVNNEVEETIISTIYALCADEVVVRGFWIGLSDREEQETYVWDDGTPLERYGNWAPNEPNNKYRTKRGYQDCVQLWKLKEFKWDDDWCSKPKSFICQSNLC